jgi:hypothetical protein
MAKKKVMPQIKSYKDLSPKEIEQASIDLIINDIRHKMIKAHGALMFIQKATEVEVVTYKHKEVTESIFRTLAQSPELYSLMKLCVHETENAEGDKIYDNVMALIKAKENGIKDK